LVLFCFAAALASILAFVFESVVVLRSSSLS